MLQYFCNSTGECMCRGDFVSQLKTYHCHFGGTCPHQRLSTEDLIEHSRAMADEATRTKITLDEWRQFMDTFQKQHRQRLGQLFCNMFNIDSPESQKLFYEENTGDAMKDIWMNYVDSKSTV